MKAIVCTAYGSPHVLQLQEVETPAPKDSEVLIKIHTASVTTGDCRLRGFRVPLGFWLPTRIAFGLIRPRKKIPGMDFSGVIESVGEHVSGFKKGDRVCGSTGMKQGTYAEYLCLAENKALIKIPDKLSHADAVAILFGGLTAVYFLRDKADIETGQRLLVNGASGAVGTAAVQIAKFYGAEVTGVCSTANQELVTSIGADNTIDYTVEDFTDSNETYDVILDTVGNLSFSKCRNSLAQHGKLILINSDLHTNILSIVNRQLICGVAGDNRETIGFLIDLVSSGAIKPVIDKEYTLENTAEAHSYVDKGHKKGNVVLRVFSKN